MVDIQKLLRGLAHASPSHRLRILTVLGKVESLPAGSSADEVVEGVARYTNDPDPAVRHAARETLGRLRALLPKESDASPAVSENDAPAPARSELIERLTHPDPKIRIRAVRDIDATGDRGWLARLKERLPVEPHEFVLATLVKAVGRLGGPAEIEAIRPHLSSADARVRANAIEGLGLIGTSAIADLVKPFVTDPDNRVAANAILALGLFDARAALEAASRMLAAPDPAMKESAIHVLRELGGCEAFDLLAAGVGSADPPAIRRRAIRALDALHTSLPASEQESRKDSIFAALERLRTAGAAEEGEDPAELATIYENLEHWDDAIREYKRALAERPGNWSIIKRVRECARKRDGK